MAGSTKSITDITSLASCAADDLDMRHVRQGTKNRFIKKMMTRLEVDRYMLIELEKGGVIRQPTEGPDGIYRAWAKGIYEAFPHCLAGLIGVINTSDKMEEALGIQDLEVIQGRQARVEVHNRILQVYGEAREPDWRIDSGLGDTLSFISTSWSYKPHVVSGKSACGTLQAKTTTTQGSKFTGKDVKGLTGGTQAGKSVRFE